MRKKILICDDDEGILDMLEILLDSFGFDIIPEKNSLQVYSLIERHRPDLILLDLWMPVLSGDQVLKTIRASTPAEELPVIFISASRDIASIAAGAGANDYITKPFDVELLLEKIIAALN